jgi:DNA helicase-2/ATP-dependent DNA helicase PcrA
MSDFLNQLNDNQREAVQYNDGPSLVIAGAGSGKTRVLTYKIAYLLSQGIAPWNILALTFTNKAAKEMKTRIGSLVGEETANRLWAGTFHSIFSRILRREADKIGYNSDFTVYDAQDSQNLVKAIIKENQLDDKIYKPSSVLARISNAKNCIITPEIYAEDRELRDDDRRQKRDLMSFIYTTYRNRCRAANVLDFDDLLLNTYLLFKNEPEVAGRYRNHFRFILVDEYQDTNAVQHAIVRQLAEEHHRVCVVGDDAQSIYSFRGANIGNILNFRTTYPEAKLFKLEQNYRSTQTIVNAANSLIANNREQIPKTVFSRNAEGEAIRVINAYSDYEEGYNVAGRIAEMRMLQKCEYSDFAILYRTNAQSRIFEESLRKINIPYRIYGGLSFYQRREVKDVIAYMRVVANPNDEEALKRIINYPTRGIGDTTVGKIAAAAHSGGVSLWTVICNPLQYGLNVNSGTAAKIAMFRDLIQKFIDLNKTQNVDEVGGEIIRQSGLYNDLYADKTPEGVSRVQNIEELQNSLYAFVAERLEEGAEQVSTGDFLAEVSLMTDQDTDKDEQASRVTMMTIHASKGLEFRNVFVVGLEENLFPSERCANNPREIEEERRLFYVAITRAKENVTLTYSKSRYRNGQAMTCTPSRFIRNIDATFLRLPGELNAQSRFETPTVKPSFYVNQRTISQPAAVNKTMTSIGNLTVGQTVLHDRFGEGKILELSGEGDNAKASVEFKNCGKKQMLLKFARLQSK